MISTITIIKAARIQRNLQQAELAELAGISAATLSAMETGKPVGARTAKLVCKVLNISLEESGINILPKRIRR